MKKNDVVRYKGKYLRILNTIDDKVLVIDCVKKYMPYWTDLFNELEVIDILDYGNVRFGKVRTKNNELLINVDKDFDKKNVHLSFDSNDLYVYSTDVDMRSC